MLLSSSPYEALLAVHPLPLLQHEITPWSVYDRHLALHLCIVWVSFFQQDLASCVTECATEGRITACILRNHILVFIGTFNL